ncbi:helix-turn-helix transcriptional regulator [Singulisphaera sp. PoT]|uniref:helix-turn-helix transcriptional regulator n=1 Tax=Singulisphaera sp. PoT TaxID=3411797 RepID=UPI003BF507BC
MKAKKTRASGRAGSKAEPLLTLDGVAAMLNAGRRTVERLRSDGDFPKPDLNLGVSPRWRASTIDRWIDEQAAKD